MTPDAGLTRRGLPWPFWVALLVLAANDHLLKGSGLVPAALTGKLSDFAGLIVAPLLLCTLLRARTPAVRVLAFASVVAPFAAMKLVPGVAADIASLLTDAGLPSRIVCDPSDLLALTLLPWTWRLAGSARPVRATAHAWLHRFGIAAAALACTATSMAGPERHLVRPPFVINWTRFDLEVAVELQLGPGACAEAAEEGALRVHTLAPGEFVELVPLPSGTDAAADGVPAGVACGGEALLSVDAGAPLRVSWSERLGEPERRLLESSAERAWYLAGDGRAEGDNAWVIARGIAISGAPGALELRVGSELEREVSK